MKLLLNALFFLLLTWVSCNEKEHQPPVAGSIFDSIPAAKPLTPLIREISGIAASQAFPQHLWGHEDSGNPPRLYLIKNDGTVQKKVFIKGAANRDWEDMARAENDLYIGDIGDNNSIYTEYTIYKFTEPTGDTVNQVEAIRFQYPDGAHDAEAMLVDPVTKDIYIITKRDALSLIYKIKAPYSATERHTAVKAGQLAYGGVVSAALSPDVKGIIVKTYAGLFYYNRAGNPIETALQTTPVRLSYTMEPQGEAVSFASDNGGFFTLSEKGFASAVNLYFYKRR